MTAGPTLELMGFSSGRDGGVTVHVKRPGEMFGLTLERALRRIEEFNQNDQGWFLALLPAYYDIPATADSTPSQKVTP
jgi:hypothetical protein